MWIRTDVVVCKTVKRSSFRIYNERHHISLNMCFDWNFPPLVHSNFDGSLLFHIVLTRKQQQRIASSNQKFISNHNNRTFDVRKSDSSVDGLPFHWFLEIYERSIYDEINKIRLQIHNGVDYSKLNVSGLMKKAIRYRGLYVVEFGV